MLKIEKAVSEDFESIHPLLQQFEGSTLSKDDWKRIFVPPWASAEGYCGFKLLKDGAVKGFLGLLFSQRLIGNRFERFANMTSWIVSEDCRSHSIQMLLAMLKLKDYTLTNFTASNQVAAILKGLGFTEYETHQRVLFPVPSFAPSRKKCRCEFEVPTIRGRLSATDRTILDDHLEMGCEHVLLSSDKGDCYVVFKRTVRKGLPFARAHYLSDRGTFLREIDSSRATICRRLRVAGLLVEDRSLGGQQLRWARSYPQQKRAYFKSSTLEASDIDTLYSELVLLHD